MFFTLQTTMSKHIKVDDNLLERWYDTINRYYQIKKFINFFVDENNKAL